MHGGHSRHALALGILLHTRAAAIHALLRGINKPLRRPDHINPEEMDRDHEDERMDRRSRHRGLAGAKDTTGPRGQGQKNTRAENKEENRNEKVEHLILGAAKLAQIGKGLL